MKPGTNLKALILSILLLLGFMAKSLQAQTDSTKSDTTMMRTDTTYTIVDLYTGQPIDIWYDPAKYVTINRATSQPVDFYVVNNTDTVHGVTGLVVNGMILKEKDNKYKLDNSKVKWEGDELKIKETNGRKVKWEKGKLQIKDWKGKEKSDNKSGKSKDQWGKLKWKNNDWVIEPVM